MSGLPGPSVTLSERAVALYDDRYELHGLKSDADVDSENSESRALVLDLIKAIHKHGTHEGGQPLHMRWAFTDGGSIHASTPESNSLTPPSQLHLDLRAAPVLTNFFVPDERNNPTALGRDIWGIRSEVDIKIGEAGISGGASRRANILYKRIVWEGMLATGLPLPFPDGRMIDFEPETFFTAPDYDAQAPVEITAFVKRVGLIL